jgi:hypothetical protein
LRVLIDHDVLSRRKAEGWGVIAKNPGIKPGSREFHELKKDLTATIPEMVKARGRAKGKERKDDPRYTPGSCSKGEERLMLPLKFAAEDSQPRPSRRVATRTPRRSDRTSAL